MMLTQPSCYDYHVCRWERRSRRDRLESSLRSAMYAVALDRWVCRPPTHLRGWRPPGLAGAPWTSRPG